MENKIECVKCRFYMTKTVDDVKRKLHGNDVEYAKIYTGRCHKQAPGKHGWPKVLNTDWCGDFKLRE